MYIAVVTLKMDKNRLTDGVRVWNQEIKPRLAQEPGLAASYFAVDEASGQALSVGFWSGQDLAQGFESSGRINDILKPLDPFLTAPRSRVVYGLVGQEGLALERMARAAGIGLEQVAPVSP